jgi:hypothetical protein
MIRGIGKVWAGIAELDVGHCKFRNDRPIELILCEGDEKLNRTTLQLGIAVALMIAHNRSGVKPMLEQYLVRNTTREEREKIIRDSLGCGGGGCENCSACGVYGAGDPLDMYQPYIEGLKEIEDINREFKARYFR